MAGKAFEKGKSYVVQHTMVDVHRAGEVIAFTEGQIKGLGVDLKRLLDLGAIREATDDEAKDAVEYGTSNEDVARVFPAVPFESTPPAHREIVETSAPETT